MSSSDARRTPTLGLVLRSISLLVGLPLVLHTVLMLSQDRVGGWPAAVLTLAVGVALSVGYQRRGAEADDEPAAPADLCTDRPGLDAYVPVSARS